MIIQKNAVQEVKMVISLCLPLLPVAIDITTISSQIVRNKMYRLCWTLLQMGKKFQIVLEKMKVRFAAIKLLNLERSVTVVMTRRNVRNNVAIPERRKALAINKIRRRGVKGEKIQNALPVKGHVVIGTADLLPFPNDKNARWRMIVPMLQDATAKVPNALSLDIKLTT
jgi:hypothetical protein